MTGLSFTQIPPPQRRNGSSQPKEGEQQPQQQQPQQQQPTPATPCSR